MIAWIEGQSKALLRALDGVGWNQDLLDQIVNDTLLPAHPVTLSSCHLVILSLTFACAQIVPKLRQGAHDEIANLLHALDGGFIPPGPSGAPTRGMAHVLPTGRNFYAVDPRALPSMAAWQVGQGLADDLLRRHLREAGAYPTRVGISIWGTSAMRTSGDDIAQVLALLGVRPRWQAENRRVVGIEVIPPAELGRPRIDVVCRISGFFRDAFPHLIALLDQAVAAVIALDEPLGRNYPRRHALAAERRLLDEGRDAAQARQEARYRVFGCAPGSYGAGILPLIDAGNWGSDADFAEVYLTWGGYAYTAEEQGVAARSAFAHALSGVQVATKNQDNREHDIFDSDDYLQFHGGMIATIRALTGQNPARYFGDSSDPARPRTRDLREEARRVYRSRVVNPKWIESMKRHGYKGGLELAATVDYLFGYDATAQVLDDWMYHGLADAYLRDEEMQQFFADSNPWAWQAIAERLLEAIERGLWQDPDPLDQQLLEAARSVGLSQLARRSDETR
jgi:cobaltochelatase CobN